MHPVGKKLRQRALRTKLLTEIEGLQKRRLLLTRQVEEGFQKIRSLNPQSASKQAACEDYAIEKAQREFGYPGRNPCPEAYNLQKEISTCEKGDCLAAKTD